MQRWLLPPPYLAWRDYSALEPADPALGSVVLEACDDDSAQFLATRLRVSILPPWFPRIVAASPDCIRAMRRSTGPRDRPPAAEVSLMELETSPPPAAPHRGACLRPPASHVAATRPLDRRTSQYSLDPAADDGTSRSGLGHRTR